MGLVTKQMISNKWQYLWYAWCIVPCRLTETLACMCFKKLLKSWMSYLRTWGDSPSCNFEKYLSFLSLCATSYTCNDNWWMATPWEQRNNYNSINRISRRNYCLGCERLVPSLNLDRANYLWHQHNSTHRVRPERKTWENSERAPRTWKWKPWEFSSGRGFGRNEEIETTGLSVRGGPSHRKIVVTLII